MFITASSTLNPLSTTTKSPDIHVEDISKPTYPNTAIFQTTNLESDSDRSTNGTVTESNDNGN